MCIHARLVCYAVISYAFITFSVLVLLTWLAWYFGRRGTNSVNVQTYQHTLFMLAKLLVNG